MMANAKRTILLVVGLFLSQPLWAEMNIEPLLNKVTLQLQAEQWVTTTTAVVTVGVNVSSSDQGIEKVQNQVMGMLSQLSDKGVWHIVSYTRQEDRSGLEAIQIMAEARLPQSALSSLRDTAKKISKPGQTYTIEGVEFSPSDEEIRQANINLRNEIYSQVTTEVEALNKKYPDQKFYMHKIDFLTAAHVMMSMAKVSRAVSSTPLAVGNKQSMHATVLLASWPEQLTQKITRNII